MAEFQIADTDMILILLTPDGTIDGVPAWSVVSGHGTLLGDPAVWDAANQFPKAHEAWDTTAPEGYQMFLVSDTLPANEDGPVDTVYQIVADIDKGAGVQVLQEQATLHVINRTTTLGLSASIPMRKP